MERVIDNVIIELDYLTPEMMNDITNDFCNEWILLVELICFPRKKSRNSEKWSKEGSEFGLSGRSSPVFSPAEQMIQIEINSKQTGIPNKESFCAEYDEINNQNSPAELRTVFIYLNPYLENQIP